MMTEAQAHAALAGYDSFDGLESWIAEQPWMAVPGGWTVAGELQGWRYRLEVMAGGGVRQALCGSIHAGIFDCAASPGGAAS